MYREIFISERVSELRVEIKIDINGMFEGEKKTPCSP